jgi:hypothetical protein
VKGRRVLVAGMLAGAASGALHAQQSTERAASGASTQDQAPRLEFRGSDGKLLPPDVQRELAEQFRKNPSPAISEKQSASKAETDVDVVVAARRARGSVVGDIPPQRTFSRLDLRAFGADNIGALLEAIGPQVASNRGRGDDGPVTLLNGRRVSDFSEIVRIPAEAIERMEVFPEELALRYGYRADQKVVNIVTYARFRSRVGQGTYITPTQGGRDAGAVSTDYLAIRDDKRIGLGATYSRARSLLESGRDVRQLPGLAELGRSRTLLPETEQFTLNGLLSGRLLDDLSATLNARFETSRSDSLVGPGGKGPLRRDSDQSVAHVGTTLSGQRGPWQWTLTANYDRTRANILTDVTYAMAGRDEARSVDKRANADLLLTGPVVELPAGPLSVSLRSGFDFRDFQSRSSRGGAEERADISRDRGGIQVDLDLPLLSEKKSGAAPLGTLSANANFAVERLSDAGSLRTFGYGLVWSPFEALNLIFSAIREEGAPTLEQLGGPMLITPNVRTYDFVRREVVDVTRVSGGNPDLQTDDRSVVRLGLNLRPLVRTDLSVSVDYVSTRIDDPIAAFPIVTPQIEAAFLDRFGRGNDGRLQRIDGRPVNFTESRQRQLRWGINFTRPLGSVPQIFQNASIRTYTSGEEARRLNPNAVFTRAEQGSAMAQGIGNLTSRLFVSVYHNWYLQDEVTLRGGRAGLDLLNGEAIDFQGGRRRHEIELQAGAFKGGLGARVTTTWRSSTEIRGLGDAARGLRFGDLATVNFYLFLNLAERFGGTRAPGWMKGARATIGVTNLFNARPLVRDGSGTAPLSYQPAYLDPLGRLLNVTLRKVF